MEQNVTEPTTEPTGTGQGQAEGAEQKVAEGTQPEEKSVKKEIQQQIRKYKLKVNGSEREVDEKTAIALAQKGLAADEKFQKSAQRAKQVEQLLQMAKKDPDRFMKQVLGQDAVEFSKKRLAKELEQLSLDPKEKQLRKYKAQVEAYEAEKKAAEQARQKESQEKAVAHWTQHYDKVLPEAIKGAGLPLTEDVIRHATDIMIANLEQGFDLPMEAVMQLTRDRYLTSIKKFLGSADKDKLTDLLGEQVVAKLGLSGKKPQKPQGKQAVVEQPRERVMKSEAEQIRDLEQRIKKWQAGE